MTDFTINERVRVAHDQEVRRLVLLIMVSSPVPSWTRSGLSKVLRIRSTHVSAAIRSLVDTNLVQPLSTRVSLASFLRRQHYGVTTLGFRDSVIDKISPHGVPWEIDDPLWLSRDSLTGLLPVGDFTDRRADTANRRLSIVQAPPMFAICTAGTEDTSEALAWGMHFKYYVVMTSLSGAPLGQFPNSHTARRKLARTLGRTSDSLCVLWLPPRGSARARPAGTVRDKDAPRRRTEIFRSEQKV